MSAIRGYTEVYVWLGRDEKGYVTNSFEGFDVLKKRQKENGGIEPRCGHVAMRIFPSNSEAIYVSCWPTKIGSSLAQLVKPEHDERIEGKPDTIIHLGKLNISQMLKNLDQMQGRLNKGEITWEVDVACNADITTQKNTKTNCATFVYTLIKSGGLEIKGHVYNSIWFRSRGPSNPFYQKTRCNLGDILRGSFNGAPWMNSFFTPKSLLLHAAAAAEQVATDKFVTEKNMESDRVSESPPEAARSFGETVVRGTVVTGSLALATAYMVKRR